MKRCMELSKGARAGAAREWKTGTGSGLSAAGRPVTREENSSGRDGAAPASRDELGRANRLDAGAGAAQKSDPAVIVAVSVRFGRGEDGVGEGRGGRDRLGA